MTTRVSKKFIPYTCVFTLLLLVIGCDLMSESNKSFESIAVEDVIAKSNLSEAVEYSYVADGHNRHKLDFYRYGGDKEAAVATLIWIHGGAWIEGDKTRISPFAFQLAGQGKYNLISVNYRLATDESAPWPEIIYDIKAALRWITFNSEKLGIDPDKLILAGESAGAHLAAMGAFSTGVTELKGANNPGADPQVKAAVLFYGPYNMSSLAVQKNSAVKSGMCDEPQYESPILELLDCPETNGSRYNIDSCDLKDVRAADPASYLDKTDPPVLLVHGEADCIVPWGQSRALHDELKDKGMKNTFISVEGGTHSISSLGIETVDVVSFINESLVNKKESITDADVASEPTKQ